MTSVIIINDCLEWLLSSRNSWECEKSTKNMNWALFFNKNSLTIPTIQRTHLNYSGNNLHYRVISHIFQHISITSQTNTVIGWTEMYQQTVFHTSSIFTNKIGSTSKDQATQSVTMLLRLSHILHDSRHDYTVIFDTQKIKSNIRYTLVLFGTKLNSHLLIVLCRSSDNNRMSRYGYKNCLISREQSSCLTHFVWQVNKLLQAWLLRIDDDDNSIDCMVSNFAHKFRWQKCDLPGTSPFDAEHFRL